MEKDHQAWRLIDAHCHLIDYFDLDEVGVVLERARKAGIELIKENATIRQTFERVLEIHKSFPEFIVPALGYHPWYLKSLPEGWDSE